MSKKVEHIVNVVLAAVGLAMGVAVVVMTTISADVSTNDLIRLLAIGIVPLGIIALRNNQKEE
jgi:hypothetical protein